MLYESHSTSHIKSLAGEEYRIELLVNLALSEHTFRDLTEPRNLRSLPTCIFVPIKQNERTDELSLGGEFLPVY